MVCCLLGAVGWVCKNHLPYNLYCVGGDVKHCSLTHSLTHQYIYHLISSCDVSYSQLPKNTFSLKSLICDVQYAHDTAVYGHTVLGLATRHHGSMVGR